MVNLKEMHGLPFCDIQITHNKKTMIIENVLIDTGSGGTILKMDKVEQIDITIDENDTIEIISGVGGEEFVYLKIIDELLLGDFRVKNFQVEIGVMDYGFDINGIIGINFLKTIEAVINLKNMTMDIYNKV